MTAFFKMSAPPLHASYAPPVNLSGAARLDELSGAPIPASR